MDTPMFFLWLGILVLAVFVEALTSSMVSVWFAPAALASMILAAFSVRRWIQVVVFFVLSICFIFLFERFFRRYFKGKASKRTNTDLLIGQKAMVVEAINNLTGSGAVRLNGQEWSARSESGEEIRKDTVVEVLSISGVKLICKPVQ